jgi:hypothetical protein
VPVTLRQVGLGQAPLQQRRPEPVPPHGVPSAIPVHSSLTPGQGMAQIRGLSSQQPGTRAQTCPVGQSRLCWQPEEMHPSPSAVLSAAARQ